MINSEAYIITYQHRVGHPDNDGESRDAYVTAANAAAAILEFLRLYNFEALDIRQVIALTLKDSRELYTASYMGDGDT